MVACMARQRASVKIGHLIEGLVDPETGRAYNSETLAKAWGVSKPTALSYMRGGVEKADLGVLMTIAEWLTEKLGKEITVNDLLVKH